jgi:threonine dehydrogenase-like Zn-dependent dehydrogenase
MAIGHEPTGEIAEIGDAVIKLKVGDRVSVPLDIGSASVATASRD